jgi:hypothetical protein
MSPDQVAEVQRAADIVQGSPPGTPIVFVVDERNPAIVAFHVTDWGNIIRAVMPPDRIPDVHLYVGTNENLAQNRPSIIGDQQHDAISRLYLTDLDDATAINNGTTIVCTLPAFNPASAGPSAGCTTQTAPIGASTTTGDVNETSPANSWSIVASGVAILLLLSLIGYGWAVALIDSASEDLAFTRTALSPAFGAAVLTLVAIAADRIGLRLTGAVPPVVTVLAGLGGYLFAWRHRRLREQAGSGSETPAKIDE